VSEEQLHADEVFLGIIAAFFGQAIQINRMVMRQKEELLEENRQLRDQVRDRYRFENIIGDSPAMHEVFGTVGQVANSRATVLLSGEIGTLEPQLQVKLLRVLQEREFERVGDTQTVKVDVRVIAATNVDLQEEVARNTFREDLFYRLNVVNIYLPPLRNRREDIPRLIDYFLDKYNAINGRSLKRISREMLSILLRYPWPGNVRELENAVERAVVLSSGEDFTEDLLPLSVRMFAAQRRSNQASESIETLCRRLADQAIADFEL